MRLASWVLPVAVAGVALGSILAFRDPRINVWMTPVSRNLSFCEQIFNFMLWTALIRNRDYDRLLVFISAGIGIQVTGKGDRIHHSHLHAEGDDDLAAGHSSHGPPRSSASFTWAWAF